VRGPAVKAGRHVIVNFQNLLLVTAEFGNSAFESAQDASRVAAQANTGRALFHGFHGVFDLI
jgi:hypothetical protein